MTQVSGFTSSTKLKGGHNGLITTTGAASKLTINGSGLANGQPVTVIAPAQSASPTYVWEGPLTNVNKDGTQGTAVVTQKHKHTTKDDPTTVSITVGGSSPTNVNTYTGTAP